MQTMIARRPVRATVTSFGLTQSKRCEILASHGYYYGGSSSPSFVLVLSVSDDAVIFCDTYKLEVRREQRGIFGHLAARAEETMRKDAARTAEQAKGADESTAMGRLAVQVATMCAWRLTQHGALVSLESFDRIRVTMTAPAGVDVYPFADRLGTIADFDGEARTAIVETNNRDFNEFVKAGLAGKWPIEVVSVETIKACPKA